MSVNSLLLDHEERETGCKYCGERDCPCADEINDRARDDEREER